MRKYVYMVEIYYDENTDQPFLDRVFSNKKIAIEYIDGIFTSIHSSMQRIQIVKCNLCRNLNDAGDDILNHHFVFYIKYKDGSVYIEN